MSTGSQKEGFGGGGCEGDGIFISWETTDYRDQWEDGSGCERISEYWRKGLIAQLLGVRVSDLHLQPTIDERVVFTSAAALQQRVKIAVKQTSMAFDGVVKALVQKGELMRNDSATFHLQCRIEVVDRREIPHAELPELDRKWCSASLRDVNVQLP